VRTSTFPGKIVFEDLSLHQHYCENLRTSHR